VPVGLVEAAQPIEHRETTRLRAVKPNRHLRVLVRSPHYLSMYQKWYIVQRFVLSRHYPAPPDTHPLVRAPM
jgi:hypothetical protein